MIRLAEHYQVKTALNGSLRIIEFDLRKYSITPKDFDGLITWLSAKSDGSVILKLEHLDYGVISIYQNESQYRTTTITSVQHQIERIIQNKKTPHALVL